RSIYSTIASINAILSKIDENRSVFRDETMFKLIKGELYGLRAYLHFDVLRLYGPVPSQIDPSVRLPYVTKLSKEINELIPYEAFLAKVKADLAEAETNLAAS